MRYGGLAMLTNAWLLKDAKALDNDSQPALQTESLRSPAAKATELQKPKSCDWQIINLA
jgi:hypothetical protein